MDARSTSTLSDRQNALRAQLGPERVDALLEAAGLVGASYLPGEEDPVFGFLQRILIHLKNQDRNQGMLFPKTDEEYKRFYDYFDGEGRIMKIEPGAGMAVDPGWVRLMPDLPADHPFYEVAPGAGPAIVTAFLEAYAVLRARC